MSKDRVTKDVYTTSSDRWEAYKKHPDTKDYGISGVENGDFLIYYRTSLTEKPCVACYKPLTHVLRFPTVRTEILASDLNELQSLTEKIRWDLLG